MKKLIVFVLFGVLCSSAYASGENCEDFTGEGDEERYECCLQEHKQPPVAKWEGGRCKCIGEKKQWEYDENKEEGHRGQCVDICEVTLSSQLRCANGNGLSREKKFTVKKSELDDIGVGDCDELKAEVAQIEDLDQIKEYLQSQKDIMNEIDEICGGTDATVVSQRTTTVSQEVINAKASLDKFFMTAESDASVWKDADGKFNTARLASDLTAGVVLGTVGGVVSGVVIKKKQVEKGFDALNCSVGGQKIAGWGDTFSVGMRR